MGCPEPWTLNPNRPNLSTSRAVRSELAGHTEQGLGFVLGMLVMREYYSFFSKMLVLNKEPEGIMFAIILGVHIMLDILSSHPSLRPQQKLVAAS